MKHIIILTLICSLAIFSLEARAATGDLQVTCEPGVNIYIDGQFKGTTNSNDNGLFVEGITPGSHTLKASKAGFNDKEISIKITANKTAHYKMEFEGAQEKVKQLQPEVEKSSAAVGKIELRSVPYGAKVYLDGKYKGDGDIEVENVSAGQHRITFESGKQKLSGTFMVTADQTLKLKGHFKENRIINISELEAQEAKKYLPFVDNGDGTITENNRMWADEQHQGDLTCSSSYECGYMIYQVCEKLNLAGYSDWRLPTLDEVRYGLGSDDEKLRIFKNLYRFKDWAIWVSLSNDSRRDKNGSPFVAVSHFGNRAGYYEKMGGSAVFCVRNR